MQTILSGIATGCIYGLVATGFSIIFYVTRVINFAQGQVLMVAVVVVAEAASNDWPMWLALVAGLASAGLVGVLIYLIAVKPVLAFSRLSFAWLVTTLGMAIVLENGAAIVVGTESQSYPPMLNNQSVHIGSAVLTGQDVLTIGVTAVLIVGLEIFRRKTFFGKLGMAVSEDPEMASAVGANTTAMAIATFAIGGIFAGIAGILIGPQTFSNPYLGDTYGIYGFVALMIAGTDRPAAAVLGGLVLGVVEEYTSTLINPQAVAWFPFALVILFLLLAPRGLFARGTPLGRSVRRLVPVRGAQS